MAERPINLRRARKARARAGARMQGNANAAAHGVPKAVRSLEEARAAKAARDLEGHRLRPGPDKDPGA